MNNPKFIEMKNEIENVVHSEAKSVSGFTNANMQRCFAIKPKVNELLDVVRQAYCEMIDNMMSK